MEMKLSKRLELIASFVRDGSRVADVGTDHGYIPVYLTQSGRCPSAIAMDVRRGPLERAEAHVRERGLEDRIELRLSDGLEALMPGEADTVVIAGMGGELICRILKAGHRVWETWEENRERFILSPQSEQASVRYFLEANGFILLREAMIRDAGKYYVIMEAARGQMKLQREMEYIYGPLLLRQRDPVLREYLKKERRAAEDILSSLRRTAKEKGSVSGEYIKEENEGAAEERIEGRIRELERQLLMIEEAEHEMQGDN